MPRINQEIQEELDQLDQWLQSKVIDRKQYDTRKAALIAEAASSMSVETIAEDSSVPQSAVASPEVDETPHPEAKIASPPKPPQTAKELALGWTVLAAMACVGWWGISAGISYFSGDTTPIAQTKAAQVSETIDRATTSSTTKDQPMTGTVNSSIDFKLNGTSATIQGIGLGSGPQVCPDGIQQITMRTDNNIPTALANVCSFGKDKDRTTVLFDAKGEYAIFVLRSMYLISDDTDLEQLFAAAREHYGDGGVYEPKRHLVGYGNTFEMTMRNGSVTATPTESGRGLLIEGFYCMQNGCNGNRGVDFHVTFALQDKDEYAKAMLEGGAMLKAKLANDAASVKF